MQFRPDQIAMMVATFPSIEDERVRTLLPSILEEWGRIDLSKHLARRSPKETRAEQRRLEQVANLTTELGDAVSGLDQVTYFALATRLVAIGAETKPKRKRRAEPSVEVVLKHLGDERGRLEHLARAAAETAAVWTPLPFRHGSVRQYLVLQDLAAIFEYVTGQVASRRVRGEDHPEAGKDYGPFWDFAAATWQTIFGSSSGLSAALKRWARARQQYDEASPVIANLALRHPEWRIYRH